MHRFVFVLCIFCLSASLEAEWRNYQTKRPIAAVLEQFLDQMGKQKIRFTIQRVFDGNTEGAEGFVLRLLPRGTLCTLLFHPKSKKGLSRIRIFTQNKRDAQLFGRIMLDKLKMKEAGVFTIKDDAGKWPKP